MIKQPVGVVAAVVAWNVPFFLACNKLGPALLAGCTVVLKPAAETPLSAYALAEVLSQAGLPEGVLSIVPGGADTGRALTANPEVDKFTFTGSSAVGREIGKLAAEKLKPCTLELGGKSAAIILEDADLAATLPMLVFSGLMNSGQACVGQTRILAPRSRYEEVVEKLAAAAAALTVGLPDDPAAMIGPLISARQRERVEGYIQTGISEGARLVTGGGRPEGLEGGWFLQPTVFADVDNAMTIAQEGIFGPVLAVIPYDTEDDAVRIANDSVYGLAGSVYTQDFPKAMEIAGRIRTPVPTPSICTPSTPALRSVVSRIPVSAARTGPRESRNTSNPRACFCPSATHPRCETRHTCEPARTGDGNTDMPIRR